MLPGAQGREARKGETMGFPGFVINQFLESPTYCGYCKCDPCRCTDERNGDWVIEEEGYTDEDGNPIEPDNRPDRTESAGIMAARANRSHERPVRPARDEYNDVINHASWLW